MKIMNRILFAASFGAPSHWGPGANCPCCPPVGGAYRLFCLSRWRRSIGCYDAMTYLHAFLFVNQHCTSHHINFKCYYYTVVTVVLTLRVSFCTERTIISMHSTQIGISLWMWLWRHTHWRKWKCMKLGITAALVILASAVSDGYCMCKNFAKLY